MSKLTQKVNALREALRDADGSQSDSFSEVFGSFLELGEKHGLMEASKPYEDEAIRVLVEQVAREYTHDPALELSLVQILHHRAGGLVHGMLGAGPHLGTFFFFLQEQQGIVAFAASMSVMHYYRITATQLPPGMFIKKKRWSSRLPKN